MSLVGKKKFKNCFFSFFFFWRFALKNWILWPPIIGQLYCSLEMRAINSFHLKIEKKKIEKIFNNCKFSYFRLPFPSSFYFSSGPRSNCMQVTNRVVTKSNCIIELFKCFLFFSTRKRWVVQAKCWKIFWKPSITKPFQK